MSRMTSPTAGATIRLPASGFLTLSTKVVIDAFTWLRSKARSQSSIRQFTRVRPLQ